MRFLKSFTLVAVACAALLMGTNAAKATNYSSFSFGNGYNNFNAYTLAYPQVAQVKVQAFPVLPAYYAASAVCAQPIQYQSACEFGNACNNVAVVQQYAKNISSNNGYSSSYGNVSRNITPIALIANNNNHHGYNNVFAAQQFYNRFAAKNIHGHNNVVQVRRFANNGHNNVVQVRRFANNGHNNVVQVRRFANNGHNNVVQVRRFANNGHNNVVQVKNVRRRNNVQRIVVRQGRRVQVKNAQIIRVNNGY